MKDTPLNRFVEEVMGINLGYAGLGGAEAGIFGSSSTNDQIVMQLRSAAIAFANEYVKKDHSAKALAERARTLEGELRTVKLVNGISDAKFDRLVAALHALLDEARK